MGIKCPSCKKGVLKIVIDTAYTYRRVKNKGIMRCNACEHKEIFR